MTRSDESPGEQFSSPFEAPGNSETCHLGQGHAWPRGGSERSRLDAAYEMHDSRTREVEDGSLRGRSGSASNVVHRVLRFVGSHPFILGPLAIVWVLVRSGPKPSRLQYPCQRFATAQGALFFGLVAHRLWRLMRTPGTLRNLAERGAYLGLFALLASLGPAEARTSRPITDHAPMGLQAALSRRVVRIHSANSTNWDFSTGFYYDHINQGVVQRMLDRGVMELTGAVSVPAAWRSIMVGYQAGDRVAIKINNNNDWSDDQGTLNSDPEAIAAIVAGLRTIGVPESDIYVYDASRSILSRQLNGVHSLYPGVRFVDNGNVTWDSQPLTGSFGSVNVPTVLTQSDHLINLHMMKMHALGGAGITGAFKNHLGSTSQPSAFHDNFPQAVTELNSFPPIKDRTRLFVNEALIASQGCCEGPMRFQSPNLFPEDTPNSLFLSLDPVAIDSVVYDYFMESGGWGDAPYLHVAADAGLGVHEHGTLGPGPYTPQDLTYQVIDYVNLDLDSSPPTPTPTPVPTQTFTDVPPSHPYYHEIEALYRAGYTAGCNTNPLMYCPEATMNRAESAVFVERGIHTASYDPPTPSSQVFADMPLDSWAAKWVNGLWEDQYTAGCGTDPLVYCPWQGHTRAEGCVFYLRMLNGSGFQPPQPTAQTFTDVALDTWYAKWVQAAYDAQLIEACATSPELRFCPSDPLTRALAAYMMVQAKGLIP